MDKLNIGYLHGFGSSFNIESDKCVALSKIGQVHGLDIDYTIGSVEVMRTVGQFVIDKKLDLVVGTSMGGWLASHIGTLFGIPFVALNPAITPSTNLKKYKDRKLTDYTGKICYMSGDMIESYSDFKTGGCGLILLEAKDELLDPIKTQEALTNHYQVHLKPGGTHRYTSLEDDLNLIKVFFDDASLIYGSY